MINSKTNRTLLLCAALLLLVAKVALAQTVTGTLQGTIMDSKGILDVACPMAYSTDTAVFQKQEDQRRPRAECGRIHLVLL